jgi:hypothetical protein
LGYLGGAFVEPDKEFKVLLVKFGLGDRRELNWSRCFDFLKFGVEAVDFLL